MRAVTSTVSDADSAQSVSRRIDPFTDFQARIQRTKTMRMGLSGAGQACDNPNNHDLDSAAGATLGPASGMRHSGDSVQRVMQSAIANITQRVRELAVSMIQEQLSTLRGRGEPPPDYN